MSCVPMSLIDLDDAEKFQRHFVQPLIDAVRDEVKPLVKAQADHEDRLKQLESNQKKALVGFAGIVIVVSVVFNATVEFIRGKFSK